MKIASIIYSLILFIQGPCAGCPSGNPCAPCCSTPSGCGGGPPPPPGFAIDHYIYVLFFAALVLGVYFIRKQQRQF
ncbi:hypothetical protein [Winogradskyella wandonensis]|uniref:hypothetical protein n=1 Tax=Winogradskyella wandonensis TaxID=1442586 RepID=UPI001049D5C2|nr:hypothetical protein [Winogradskyella wandonensis]